MARASCATVKKPLQNSSHDSRALRLPPGTVELSLLRLGL